MSLNIKEKLNEAGVRPSKRLGQNFLINEGIYQKILAAGEVNPKDTIIEVGPGLGTLTERLAQVGCQVTAVEKDVDLFNYLNRYFENIANIKLVNQDILKLNPKNFGLKEKNYKLLGNIPYYLTSRLIRIVFDSPDSLWPTPKLIVFLVQKEVARKMSAKPPAMSLLSVSVQYFSEVEIMANVSRGSFYPTPNVDSAIVRLRPHAKLPQKEEVDKFFELVRIGFSSKRKQLANNLSSGFKMDRLSMESTLRTVDIDPKRRAETLTIREWQLISKVVPGW